MGQAGYISGIGKPFLFAFIPLYQASENRSSLNCPMCVILFVDTSYISYLSDSHLQVPIIHVTACIMLNICLIGSGGVGTISSLVLEKSKRAKVTAVLRSNYALVTEKGFDIDSADHGKITGWKPTSSKSHLVHA